MELYKKMEEEIDTVYEMQKSLKNNNILLLNNIKIYHTQFYNLIFICYNLSRNLNCIFVDWR